MATPNDENYAKQRAAALDAALAQIDKQFGKGSAMKLGDKKAEKIASFSTGSLSLDIALGIGGLPRGRVIEIYGPESSGKCLTADALVPTNWGLLTVAEIFEQAGSKATCTSRITDIQHVGLEVVNEYGQLEKVSALTHNNRKPVYTISTSTGKNVTVTANHPLRVLNERGNIVWRKASDIAVGDTVLGVKGGNENAKDRISTEEATLIGYLVGDGNYNAPNKVGFSQKDIPTRTEFITIMSSLYPDAVFKTYEGRPNDVVIHSKKIRDDLQLSYGLEFVKSQEKTVPWVVRASGFEVQAAFLSALFECDGSVEAGEVCLSTSSTQLAQQTQSMLLAMGIVSTVSKKTVKAYPENTYWTVRIVGNSNSVFQEKINFRSERRSAHIESIKTTERTSQVESIPHIVNTIRDLHETMETDRSFNDLVSDIYRTNEDGSSFITPSPRKIQNIVDWAKQKGYGDHPLAAHLQNLIDRGHTYETVTSVAYAGEQPTFDLVVPGTHSFVANGLAVHNTTLTLHAIASVQKDGGTAAFIDAEHALDPEYAAKLGVDIDNLIVSQPDTGEQALEIADMLIRSGGIDLVVIDSVAALVPKAEIAGEMGDSHVGLQARLMSQALRKITGGLNQTGTTAIFINQLREKIGVMFGCFSYETEVLLENGKTLPIGKIVDEKIAAKVMSYNPESGLMEAQEITSWFDNGVADSFISLEVELHGGREVSLFVTPNHQIATFDGWVSAEDLEKGDKVLISKSHSLQDRNVYEGTVVNVGEAPELSSMRKFDLEVANTHNYFVGGADGSLMVHNSPETTTGGKALKFYASVRIDIRRIGALKDGENVVGNLTKVKVVKNKVAPPFKVVEFDIIYGEGISYEGDVINLGLKHGIVRKAGAWYSYESMQLGQGKEKTRDFLKDNPEVTEEIAYKIRVAEGLVPSDEAEENNGLSGEVELDED